jgi:hypothetical protein
MSARARLVFAMAVFVGAVFLVASFALDGRQAEKPAMAVAYVAIGVWLVVPVVRERRARTRLGSSAPFTVVEGRTYRVSARASRVRRGSSPCSDRGDGSACAQASTGSQLPEGGPAPGSYEAELEGWYARLRERREAGLLTEREYCEFIDRSDR